MTGYLYLTAPAGKGMSLQFMTDDADLSEKFATLCQMTLPKSIHWFYQCGSNDPRNGYNMFEFWTDDHAGILEACMEFADLFGFELNLEEPTAAMIREMLM